MSEAIETTTAATGPAWPMTRIFRPYLVAYRESAGFLAFGLFLGIISLIPWQPLRELLRNALPEILMVRVIVLLVVGAMLTTGVVGAVLDGLTAGSTATKHRVYDTLVAKPALFVGRIAAPLLWSIAGLGIVVIAVDGIEPLWRILTSMGYLFVLGAIPGLVALPLTMPARTSPGRWWRNGRLIGVLLVAASLGLVAILQHDACMLGAC